MVQRDQTGIIPISVHPFNRIVIRHHTDVLVENSDTGQIPLKDLKQDNSQAEYNKRIMMTNAAKVTQRAALDRLGWAAREAYWGDVVRTALISRMVIPLSSIISQAIRRSSGREGSRYSFV